MSKQTAISKAQQNKDLEKIADSATYAAARRSVALRSADGSAPRTAATTAQQGIIERQTPITTG